VEREKQFMKQNYNWSRTSGFLVWQ